MNRPVNKEGLKAIVDDSKAAIAATDLSDYKPEKEYLISDSQIRGVIDLFEEHAPDHVDKILAVFGKCPLLEDYEVAVIEVKRS